MGKNGTEVARSAADMVLTDDNFSTIVAAVRQGRGIYQNIRKTIHFLLSCNMGEILVVFVAFLLRVPTPLLAIQLLWVNLVTDSLPALALGADPIQKDVMDAPPHKKEDGIFSGGMGYSVAVEGCLVGALATALTGFQWLVVGVLSLCPLLVVEGEKILWSKWGKRR